MSEICQQHKIFKAVLRAIVSDDFAPEDYQRALKNIRDGSLLKLLEQIIGALAGPEEVRQRDSKVNTAGKPPKGRGDVSGKSADDIFNDVKRRKITREQLETVLRSIDSDFASRMTNADTMRGLLKSYREHATDREWKMLTSIVNGSYETDPYLTSISES